MNPMSRNRLAVSAIVGLAAALTVLALGALPVLADDLKDARTALAQLDTAREKASLAELLVKQARENLDLTIERYGLGLATSVELTDAEVAVAQTRSQQVQAQYDELVAIALIRLNTGD